MLLMRAVLAIVLILSGIERTTWAQLSQLDGIAQPAAELLISTAPPVQALPVDNTLPTSTLLTSQSAGQNSTEEIREIQPPRAESTMQLAYFEALALASNPSLQRALYLVSAARGNALQVGLQPNPMIGYEGQQLGSRGLAEQHGVTLAQEIVRSSKRILNRSIACRDVNAAQFAHDVQRLRVLTDVRILFFRALRAQRQIEVTAQLLDISRKALQSAEALFKAQEVGKADVLQAQLEVEAATIQHENAENRRRSSWSELCAVCGAPGLNPTPLDGDLFAAAAPSPFDETLARLQSLSPEISVAATQIDRARLNLQRQLVEIQPNLSVQGLINWRDNGIGGASDGGLAVSVPVPLWNRNQGAIHQARYELAAAEQALAQLQLALQQRLAPVYERFTNAHGQVERIRDRILPAAAQTLDLTTKTYQAGEINFVALLTVQRTYNQHQLAYLDALESLRIAEAEIDGLLLANALQSF